MKSLVVVLTKTEWEVLTKILDRVNVGTSAGSRCAVLVHPDEAGTYRGRTGRPITDYDRGINYAFDQPDIVLDLIGPGQVQFTPEGWKTPPVGSPLSLAAILESIGRGPDGITELP